MYSQKKKLGKFFYTESLVKPIQFSPVINVQSDKSRLINSIVSKESSLKNLIDLRIYLNGGKKIINYSDTAKQFLSCKYEPEGELELKDIERFIDPIFKNNSSIRRISLLGGDVFQWKDLSNLVNFLLKKIEIINCEIRLYVNFSDLFYHNYDYNFFKKISLVIVIYPDEDINKLNGIIEQFVCNSIKISLCFVVENTDCVEKIDLNFNNKYNKDYTLYPYYNKRNIKFFEENVFTEMPDLTHTHLSIEEINKRSKINTANFGQLIINNNGNVYDNLNFPPIGNIYEDTISHIVQKEVDEQLRWFLVRTKVAPCNKCLFNLLCPPISNYELFFGKNNLCKIN